MNTTNGDDYIYKKFSAGCSARVQLSPHRTNLTSRDHVKTFRAVDCTNTIQKNVLSQTHGSESEQGTASAQLLGTIQSLAILNPTLEKITIYIIIRKTIKNLIEKLKLCLIVKFLREFRRLRTAMPYRAIVILTMRSIH